MHRHRIFRILPVMAIAVGAFGYSAAHAQDDTLTTYLTTVSAMNSTYLVTDYDAMDTVSYQVGTAVEGITGNRDSYQSRLDTLNALTVPDEVADLHAQYVTVLEGAVRALDAALAEADPLAAAEAGPTYIYRNADFGYVFNDENAIVCALKEVAIANGIEDFSSLFCDRALGPTEGQTVGSPEEPVSYVQIVHDPGCGGACPGILYETTTIYAKAGEPFTIEFVNNNPLPFLFNLAIYEGYDRSARLSEDALIVSTNAGGPRTHLVTLVLEPGVYTYADNVHPDLMQGELIVVG